jgi:hypothetical protein
MEQRRLRLGDILDDYCPRERRVTNHAVVAMIGEDVKQTRCTTCDAEHAFKGAREPKRRKKDTPAVLYREVLAGLPEADLAVAGAVPAAVDPTALIPPVLVAADENDESDEDQSYDLEASDDGETAETAEELIAEESEGDVVAPVEEGPVHRRLIRATLPRPEGVPKETRQVPEFTMRANPRGNFRGGMYRGNGGGAGNGNGTGHGTSRGGGRRFAGGGGAPQGGRGGFRGNNSPRPGGGGKKRSR